MKKLFIMLFTMLICVEKVFAQDFEVDGLSYRVSEESWQEVKVIGGDFKEMIEIPEAVTYEGVTYMVTSIGEHAFSGREETKKYIIPHTVRSIESFAFYDNYYLQEVEFNDGLQTIGEWAFGYNYALKEIRIPSTVRLIGEGAFCTNETNGATISCLAATPPTIEHNTFEGRTDSTLHVMVSDVKTYQDAEHWKEFSEIIGDKMYKNRCKTPSITCDNEIVTISCKTENSVIYYTTDGSIPDENAIRYSSPISFTDIPVVRAIAIAEGYENSAITDLLNKEYINITDNQGVSYTLMQEVFDGSYYYSVTGRSDEISLSNDITIPANLGGFPVRHIGNKAFASSFIKSITIPESVTSIEEGAFYDCDYLQNVTSKISQPFYVKAFNRFDRTTLFVPTGSRKAYKSAGGWNFAIIFEEGETVYDSRPKDEQGVHYTLKQKSDGSFYYSVTGGIFVTADIVIPADLGGCPVKVIEVEFSEYDYDNIIESITLPDCLTSVCARAFRNCSNLSTVTLGRGLTTIGEYAFYNCTSLETIVIPDGVTSIGEFAFSHCVGLNSVTIGNGVTSLKGGTFYKCSGLTSVFLGNSLQWIECANVMLDEDYNECIGNYGAFSSCENLSSINIPQSVHEIGPYTFSGCSSLTSITLPNKLGEICEGVFSSCGFTSINFPNNLKYIGPSAFKQCSELTSIKFPEYLASIGERAFYGCSLKIVELPNTLTDISGGTFQNNDFQYIKLGNNVKSIGKNAFGGSEFVLEIGTSVPPTISSGAFPNVKYLSDLTVIVPDVKAETAYKNKAVWEEMTYANQSNIAEVTVDTPGDLSFELIDECGMMPANVVGLKINGTINANDFTQMLTNMKALLRLDLSGCDITDIPDNALSGKAQLQELILPSKLQIIGKNAFKDCHFLTGRLDLPTTLTTIDENAFVDTEYTSVTLPHSLKTIGDYAFYEVPLEQKLTLPAKLTSVGGHAFEGTKITGVTIPDGVTTIGERAFANTPIQDHVTIPDGITYLGKEAFFKTNISTVFLPNNMTTLSQGLFQGCKNLNLVYIPDNFTDIDSYAFDGCESLTTIRFSVNTATMGEYSLQGTPIDYVKVPSNVAVLSRGVFKNSNNLVSLTLPANLKTVESEALYGCNALRNLSVEAIVPPAIKDRSAIRGINTDLCIISIPTESYREYVLAEYWGQFVQMRNDIAVEKVGNGEISFESVVEEEDTNQKMRAPSFATKEEAQTYVNNGSSIYVPKQGKVRFYIVPDAGEELLSATLDGEDITPYIVDNVYTATADKKNAKLVVKFSGAAHTAIEDVTSEVGMKNTVYNLSGQLIGTAINVNAMPKGIYIVNGKKVIVK